MERQFNRNYLLLTIAGLLALLIVSNRIFEPDRIQDHMIDLTPKFSITGGFYRENVHLELFSENRHAVIYYTLDGSMPDPTNNRESTLLYVEPIVIKDRSVEANRLSMIPTNYPNERNIWQPPLENTYKGTVVRAIALSGSSEKSKVITHTYFIDSETSSRYTMPVISIATEEANLFSEDKGIYIPGKLYNPDSTNPMLTGNYFGRGSDWEVPANMTFYEPDGTEGFSLEIGIRIHGGSSRVEPQKSLRIYARNNEDNYIHYQLFDDTELDQFVRLILRNSGNEWGHTMFLDPMAQSLMKDMLPDIQYSRPAVVFINGEYWGIHNIRERYDDWYIFTNYGVERDEVVILSGNAELQEGLPGDEKHYLDMISYVQNNDMGDPTHYDYIKTLMDIENYLDYQIAQIYVANIDWPQGNIDYWRKRTNQYEPNAPYGHDGRWRWLIYDLDCSFGFWGTHYDTNSLEMASDPNYNHNTRWGGDWQWSTVLFSSLLENPEFKEAFITRFSDHLNTTFLEENVLKTIDLFEELYQPEMPEHLLRWAKPTSMEEWHDNIETFREFASKRPESVREHMIEKFDLQGTANLNIQIPDDFVGTLHVNGHALDTKQLSWQGIYFKGMPITITVHEVSETIYLERNEVIYVNNEGLSRTTP